MRPPRVTHSQSTLAALGIAAAFAAAPARADLALAEKSACLNCHAVEKKLVGPSFRDIAAKYKGRSDADAYLADKLVKGSSGVWGPVPMPGMPALPPADVKALTAWVLKS